MIYDPKVTDAEFDIKYPEIERTYKFKGRGYENLLVGLSNCMAHLPLYFMKQSYEKLMTRDNFQEIKEKYAPTVPHVMLYIRDGELMIKNHKIIKLT